MSTISTFLSLLINADPFVFGDWGTTIWGSDDDKAALELDFSLFRDNFTNIPTFIGEWDATPVYTETAARWKYFDFFVRTAAKYDFSHSVFDNGADLLDRSAHTWYDETVIDILYKCSCWYGEFSSRIHYRSKRHFAIQLCILVSPHWSSGY